MRSALSAQRALSTFFSLFLPATILCCGLMVSSPGPCASSGGRLPEAFFLVFRLESQGTKACESCRSRQDLSNEYLPAKFGFDTAENEPEYGYGIPLIFVSLSFGPSNHQRGRDREDRPGRASSENVRPDRRNQDEGAEELRNAILDRRAHHR